MNFENLFFKIKKICEKFGLSDDVLYAHCFKKIQLLRSLKLTVSFNLGRDLLDPAIDSIKEFCVEVF